MIFVEVLTKLKIQKLTKREFIKGNPAKSKRKDLSLIVTYQRRNGLTVLSCFLLLMYQALHLTFYIPLELVQSCNTLPFIL